MMKRLFTSDIHSRVSLRRDKERPPVEPKQDFITGDTLPTDITAALDRPLVVVQRLSSTLRVPIDQPMLVGGMTFESDPKPGEPSLYLFVKASVQELRDDDDPPSAEMQLDAEPDAVEREVDDEEVEEQDEPGDR